MNSFELVLFAVALSIANLYLSFFCIRREAGKTSLFSIFWLMSLYFVGVPLLTDSLAVVLGQERAWTSVLEANDINYIYDLSPMTLVHVCLFVFLFNITFYIVNYLSSIYILGRSDTPRERQIVYPEKKLTFSACSYLSLGWIGFVLFLQLFFLSGSLNETTLLGKLYSPLVTLGAVSTYLFMVERRYIWTMFSLIPPVAIAFLTSQRPHLVPALMCIMSALISTRRVNFAWKVWIKALLFGYLTLCTLIAVRIGIYGNGAIIASQILYPVARDNSSPVMYYSFSEKGLYYIHTEFRGIKRLLLTGLNSRSLFGRDDDDLFDVVAYIARAKFNWSYGTLHPTLYGWLFTDMKWSGILFAVYISLLFTLLTRASSKSELMRMIIIAVGSMFIVVAMRGSVQFAYSRMVYSLLVGLVCFKLIKTCELVFPFDRKRTMFSAIIRSQ